MREATHRAILSAVLAGAGVSAFLSLGAQEAPPQNRPTGPIPPPPPPLPTNFARPQRQAPAPPVSFAPLPNLQPPSFQPPPIQRSAATPVAPPVVAPPVQPGIPQFQQGASPFVTLTNLAFDAERKEYTTKPGDLTANYTFWFTNISDKQVVINAVRTSCGCTVAKLPATPWPIPPGTNGPIEVTIDLRGKSGTITKSVTVESSAGVKALFVSVNVTGGPAGPTFVGSHPAMGDQERLDNMQKALADRQVVFKDAKCAACHADPAKGQVDGSVIYRGICATCHESPLRAAAVTDLKALKHETDIDYWKHWIAHGRPGSMMPAYALSEGGPLNDTQIQALAQYCMKMFQPAAIRALHLPTAVTNAAISSPAVSVYPIPTRK
jgi:mono/diheme cytochrome c family protein